MQEYRKLGIFVGILIIILPLVLASISIKEPEIAFGGSGFEKTKTVVTKTFTLSNTNLGANVTGLSVALTPQNGFSAANINIALPNQLTQQDTTINVDLTIGDFDAVDSNLKEQGQVTIAKLKIKGNENGTNPVETNEIPLKLEIENDLEIDAVELVDEDDNTNTISSGSSYDVTEDEGLTLKVKIKNAFSSNGLDLKNVKITLDSDDLNINEDQDVSDLNPGETTEIEIDFSTDDIKKGDVDLLLEGDDELGGKHGEKFSFKLDVQEKAEENNDATNEASDDSDGDGVGDVIDVCPNTVSACGVDTTGCHLDADNDGSCDELDATPNGNGQKEDDDSLLQQVNKINAQAKEDTEETQNKKSQLSFDEETEGVIPFLIGLVIGVCLTAGFFWIIRP